MCCYIAPYIWTYIVNVGVLILNLWTYTVNVGVLIPILWTYTVNVGVLILNLWTIPSTLATPSTLTTYIVNVGVPIPNLWPYTVNVGILIPFLWTYTVNVGDRVLEANHPIATVGRWHPQLYHIYHQRWQYCHKHLQTICRTGESLLSL
ncbi:MAG: hypothetical protein IPP77_01155 [Bacteroidetes bacterium]|nr:hypothetical protein [Bacteroidota bacterium]